MAQVLSTKRKLILDCIADAETEWLPTEIARDPRGFILTGAELAKTGRWTLERDPYLLETSVPGVFAIGDVRSGSVKRVGAAVGEGAAVIQQVHSARSKPATTLAD